MILRELAPTLHIPWSVPFQLDDPPIVPTTFGKMMELRYIYIYFFEYIYICMIKLQIQRNKQSN